MNALIKTCKFAVLLSLIAFVGCGEKEKKPVASSDGHPKMLSPMEAGPPVMHVPVADPTTESPVVESKPDAEKSTDVESKGNTKADEIQTKQTEIILELASAIDAGKSEEEMAPLKTRQAELFQELQALDLSATETHEVLQRHQVNYDKANERLTEATLARAKKMAEEALKGSGQ